MQARADDARARELLSPLDDSSASIAARAERALLACLEGGCQVPIGALVASESGAPGSPADGERRAATEGALVLHALLADVRGTRVVRGSQPVDAEAPERAGERLAAELRARGGEEILRSLREATKVPMPQPE